MRPRTQTTDPKWIGVYSDLFNLVPTRAQRRMIQILEAAIRNYASIGIENATYDSIAKACKVSRPLIQHYFKDKSEIFEMALKYIRATFQKIAIEEIQSQNTPTDKMRAYVGSLFVWHKKFPLHAKVWNLMYYYSAVDNRMRKVHTELADIGHRRITALLEDGVKAGEFAGGNLEERAKLIQTLYTGGLIMVSTENLYVSKKTFEEHLVQGCLDIARYNPSRPH